MVTIVQLDVLGRRVDLALFDDDHVTKVIQSTEGFYEAELLEDILRRTQPGQLALDVGAHVGNHTVFLAAVADLDVIAVEPSSAALDLLKKNVEANGVSGRVTVVEAAAGAEESAATLIPGSDDNTGMTRVVLGGDDVPVTTVDRIVGRRRVSVMKVDVEGWEKEVLRGAQTVLRRDQPILYLEVSDARHERDLRQLLNDLGYHFAKEFNATPTQMFLPMGNVMPGLYPPVLADLAAEQTRTVTQLMRSVYGIERAVVGVARDLEELIRKWDVVLSRHERETKAYREQLRQTTELFSELYKRTKAASITNTEAAQAATELQEPIQRLLERLETIYVERAGGDADPSSQ
jgi:FkbM family methyltransferase